MSREELFAYIKKNSLQKEVQEAFGDNHTRVKTTLLQSFVDTIEAANACKRAQAQAKPKTEAKAIEKKPVVINLGNNGPFKAAAVVFISYLKQIGVLDKVLAEVK